MATKNGRRSPTVGSTGAWRLCGGRSGWRPWRETATDFNESSLLTYRKNIPVNLPERWEFWVSSQNQKKVMNQDLMNLIFTNFWWPFFDWYNGITVYYHKLVDIWVAQEGCIHSIQGFTFKQQSLFHIMFLQQIMYESHAKLFSKCRMSSLGLSGLKVCTSCCGGALKP